MPEGLKIKQPSDVPLGNWACLGLSQKPSFFVLLFPSTLLQQTHLWLRQLSPGTLFLFERKSLKSNPKRETIPLYVHDKGLTLKATADI